MKNKNIKIFSIAFMLGTAISPTLLKPTEPVPASIYSMNLEQINKTETILLKLASQIIQLNDFLKSHTYEQLADHTIAMTYSSLALEALATYDALISSMNSDNQTRNVILQKIIDLFGLTEASISKLKYVVPFIIANRNKPNGIASFIDGAWLDKISIAVANQKHNLEKQHGECSRTSFTQELLLESLKKQVGAPLILAGLSCTPRTRHAVSFTSNSSKFDENAAKSLIDIVPSQDLGSRCFGVLHELGHVIHNDWFHGAQVDAGQKTATDFLESNDYKHDLQLAEKYLGLALKTLDNSSERGTVLKNCIHKAVTKQEEYSKLGTSESLFWRNEMLIDQEGIQKHRYMRTKEMRADLFALDYLWSHGLKDIIVQIVYEWTNNETDLNYIYTVALNDEHPSNIERVLYMLGFLAAHEVDINKALRDYEAHGTCSNGEDLRVIIDQLKPQQCPAKTK